MNVKDFKSGIWKKQYKYKSFTPAMINHSWVWDDPQINTLLEQATRQLAELNAFSLLVPDVDLFIRMHTIKEANASSRIEGTQTKMDEALVTKEQVAPEKRDDWQEVQNYIEAMNTSIEELKKLPLSNRLLKKAHYILMHGVRGEHKNPGEFRTSQNWIGGTSLADAVFIPPHHSEVPELMGDLEKFWHNEDIIVPHLINIAISHYQFETVHPFLDGNGRIGRLLITLYLVSNELLSKPTLYLSDYLEKHKGAYYDALTTVRSSHDLGHWIKFFLMAVVKTSEKGKQTFQAIMDIRQEVEKKILALNRRAQKGRLLLELLYSQPVIQTSHVVNHLKITNRPAGEFIKDFQRLGILKEVTGFKRNRTFIFEKYLSLFMN
ncbi:adenosine monophosphate-protein transferase SoFic [bacterium BMS3Abin07]|nr:adenosine monophosphate-protein transferase SoFic [bacterium BMS3Abin07]GBE33249.1 adenosine monophosphate-protein transferase SoFic [bacterium BMS3Bbin05]HDZ87747.1 Fic family protein [Nitrospirota bacterium]